MISLITLGIMGAMILIATFTSLESLCVMFSVMFLGLLIIHLVNRYQFSSGSRKVSVYTWSTKQPIISLIPPELEAIATHVETVCTQNIHGRIRVVYSLVKTDWQRRETYAISIDGNPPKGDDWFLDQPTRISVTPDGVYLQFQRREAFALPWPPFVGETKSSTPL